MADNMKGIPFSVDDEGQAFPDLARDIVQMNTTGTAYVVWFAYVLGNWKALCSTDVPDGRYFEVTYSKGKKVAYLDVYVKVANHEVSVP